MRQTGGKKGIPTEGPEEVAGSVCFAGKSFFKGDVALNLCGFDLALSHCHIVVDC